MGTRDFIVRIFKHVKRRENENENERECVKIPADTLRNDSVVIMSKPRHFDVITSKWRRVDVITTLLLRHVFSGMG